MVDKLKEYEVYMRQEMTVCIYDQARRNTMKTMISTICKLIKVNLIMLEPYGNEENNNQTINIWNIISTLMYHRNAKGHHGNSGAKIH